MKVQIIKVSKGYHRPGRGRNRGFISALVDGFHVLLREEKGWDCECGEPRCPHPDAVADVIHPEVLADIRGEGHDKDTA